MAKKRVAEEITANKLQQEQCQVSNWREKHLPLGNVTYIVFIPNQQQQFYS